MNHFDIGISLGCNCEPSNQLRRLGLCPDDRRFAWDFSHTRHKALLSMLRCDFRDVFAKSGSLVCDTTDFRFAYRPQPEIEKTRQQFEVRARQTRDVRASGKRVLFARAVTVPSPKHAHQEWQEVEEALKANGWSNYRLVFVIRAWHLQDQRMAATFQDCSHWFVEDVIPDTEEIRWGGHSETWDTKLPDLLSTPID